MENIKAGNVVVLKTYNENNEDKNKPPYMIIDKVLEDERIECIWFEDDEVKRVELSAHSIMLWKKFS
jgi:uncharacterized protein YodC (DUF2158 family)